MENPTENLIHLSQKSGSLDFESQQSRRGSTTMSVRSCASFWFTVLLDFMQCFRGCIAYDVGGLSAEKHHVKVIIFRSLFNA